MTLKTDLIKEVARALMRLNGENEETNNGFGGYVSWQDYGQEATAAVEAMLAKQGWQDIESAPRDGTRIIVAKIGWSHSSLERLREAISGADLEPDEYRVFFATSAHFHAKRDYWTDGLERLVDPTHWMPLPTPPIDTLQQEQSKS